MPAYIPAELGLGDKTKLTVRSSRTAVPPVEGQAYRKNPVNDSDTIERRRDAYFLGLLIALYQGREFRRWDLDAGRLNRLWCDDILVVVVPEDSAGDPEAVYRLDIARAQTLLARMADS